MRPSPFIVRLVLLLGLLISVLLTTGTALGQCAQGEDQKLVEGGAGDSLGVASSLDGNVLVVGAPGDDDVFVGGGASYVYRSDGKDWSKEAKLIASDVDTGDEFGSRVAVSGNWIAVSSWRDDNANGVDAGAVYMFHHDGTGWKERQTVLASDGETDDGFGIGLAFDGEVLAAGAWHDDDQGTEAGAVYVFRYNPGTMLWEEEDKLLGSRGSANDVVGTSVSLHEDLIVASSWGGDNLRGLVYVFRHDGTRWVEEQALSRNAGDPGDFFSLRVSVDQDRIVATAPQEKGGGAAYVFSHDGTQWLEDQRIESTDHFGGDRFGNGASLSGDLLVVSSRDDDDQGSASGSAYVFRHDGDLFVEERKLLASDGEQDDWFGICCFARGDTAVIGACRDDDSGVDAGAAYVFDVSELGLWLSTDSAKNGDVVTSTTFPGTSFGPALLAVVEVNGTPTFQRVTLGRFSSGNCSWVLDLTVPPGLSGLEIVLQAFGVAASGRTLATPGRELKITG